MIRKSSRRDSRFAGPRVWIALLAILLCALGLAPPAVAQQAPPMATWVMGFGISFEDCKARAAAAYSAEGFGDLRDFGNGWLAWSRGTGASIACIRGNNETVVSIVTAGSDASGARDRLVARMRGGPGSDKRAFCDQYAKTAIGQQDQNLRRSCGFSGPRWDANAANHFNWCMGVERGAADSETRGREEDLKKCGAGPASTSPFDPKRVYRLVAKHSGKVLDVNVPGGDQADVVQHGWHGGDNQRWRIEPVGDGYYRLVAKHSGKVLDVNVPGDDQANVVQHGWHGGDNQRWRIEPVGDGYYRLVAKHSGKVLDVNVPGGDQANVVQHGWHGGDNQRWRIEVVE